MHALLGLIATLGNSQYGCWPNLILHTFLYKHLCALSGLGKDTNHFSLHCCALCLYVVTRDENKEKYRTLGSDSNWKISCRPGKYLLKKCKVIWILENNCALITASHIMQSESKDGWEAEWAQDLWVLILWMKNSVGFHYCFFPGWREIPFS